MVKQATGMRLTVEELVAAKLEGKRLAVYRSYRTGFRFDCEILECAGQCIHIELLGTPHFRLWVGRSDLVG